MNGMEVSNVNLKQAGSSVTSLKDYNIEIERLLSSLNSNNKKKIEEITSLSDVEEYLSQTISYQDAKDIVDRIKSGDILGDANSYHNVSVELSRKDYDLLALDVCLVGVEKFQSNIDLNADAIHYAMYAGKTDIIGHFVEKMLINCSDKSLWNWRGFVFLIDYYRDYKPEGYISDATELIKTFKEVLPTEEKAYVAESEFLDEIGKHSDSIKVLEYAVENLSAPQCALTLADKYMEQGCYEKVIKAASYGIAFSAEPQPSIRVAYLLMLRAMAKDAIFIKQTADGSDSVYDAKQILREYELARKHVRIKERSTIDIRMDIIKSYANIMQEK